MWGLRKGIKEREGTRVGGKKRIIRLVDCLAGDR